MPFSVIESSPSCWLQLTATASFATAECFLSFLRSCGVKALPPVPSSTFHSTHTPLAFASLLKVMEISSSRPCLHGNHPSTFFAR